MALSNDLVSQFVKVNSGSSKKSNESTVYGTIVVYEGENYVQVDGSDALTPASTTATYKPGDRVTILIKDHSATVTGNISDPSANNTTVENVRTDVTKLDGEVTELDILVANKVSTEYLEANYIKAGEIDAQYVKTEKLEAEYATIDKLEAEYATIKQLDAKYATIDNLTAANANITNLNAEFGNFKVLTAEQLVAMDATIKDLDANKITVEDLEADFANINFANITELAVENFMAKTGMIGDLVMQDGHVTGTLVGVTIKGDLIEAGTLVADALVIQGEDGLYYRLNTNGETVTSQQTEYNSLNGSIITAQSITADKIHVTDLKAFGATIGGYHITDASLYSGVKSTVNNTTRGIYLDAEGQINFGDASSFITYYRDENDEWHLNISADNILFGSEKKSVETIVDDVKVGARNLIRNSTTMIFKDYYFYDSTESDPNPNPTPDDDETFTVTSDTNGNVTMTKTPITVSYDSSGVVTLTGLTPTYNENTVTLTK